MLPRIQRSIFHLGEEGGDGHHGDGENFVDFHRHLIGAQTQSRRLRRGAGGGADVVVGLQILVQHHRHHPQPCHVVLKQMVSWPPARHRRACSSSGACFLCRRELRPDKDVYMYRGDQGFCSEECRREQILSDEAREREAMFRKDRRGLPHHRRHHHGPRPAPAGAMRASPRRVLAVA